MSEEIKDVPRDELDYDPVVIDAYIRAIRKEQSIAAKLYFDEAIRLRDGVAEVHPETQWADNVRSSPSKSEPLKVAQKSMESLLSTYKTIEKMRCQIRGLLQMIRKGEGLSTTQRAVRDIYDISTEAVAGIRSGVVYMSSVLNSEVTPPGSRDPLFQIVRLMRQECDNALERNAADDREREQNKLLGQSELSAATAIRKLRPTDLGSIPVASEPSVHSWRLSAVPPTPAAMCFESAAAPCPEEHKTRYDLSAMKALAVQRVMEHTRKLFEAMDVDPSPRVPKPPEFLCSPRGTRTSRPSLSRPTSAKNSAACFRSLLRPATAGSERQTRLPQSLAVQGKPMKA
jgi:hypothetical protein